MVLNSGPVTSPLLRPSPLTTTAGASDGMRLLRVNTTADAPSLIGEHINKVSGSAIMRLSSTSFTDTVCLNWASGFSAPWRRFFAETAANCPMVVPYAFMWSRAREA